MVKSLSKTKKGFIFATAKGEMAEWSNAAVLKTVEGHTSGGSNPSFSANIYKPLQMRGFSFKKIKNTHELLTF